MRNLLSRFASVVRNSVNFGSYDELAVAYKEQEKELLDFHVMLVNADSKLDVAYERIESLLEVVDEMGDVIDVLCEELEEKATLLSDIQDSIEEALTAY